MKFSCPAQMSQWTRCGEVSALIHVENELIDEALGRVMVRIDERGWGADTDVVFTTDHGELQGDFGLLFKGLRFHVDVLMRAPSCGARRRARGCPPTRSKSPSATSTSLPTFCAIATAAGAGLGPRRGAPADRGGVGPAASALTEWDSQFPEVGMRLRSIYRDNWLCTAYEAGPLYEGTEGELYDMGDDPMQRHNLWDDPAYRARRDELVTDLYDKLPPEREPKLAVEAPV